MRLSLKSLVGRVVETESGERLGRVKDFAIYEDLSSLGEIVLGGLIPARLLSVPVSSVVRLLPKKIIVKDSVVGKKELISERIKKISKRGDSPVPAVTRLSD